MLFFLQEGGRSAFDLPAYHGLKFGLTFLGRELLISLNFKMLFSWPLLPGLKCSSVCGMRQFQGPCWIVVFFFPVLLSLVLPLAVLLLRFFFLRRPDALSSRSRPRAVSLSGRGGHYWQERVENG